MNSDPEILKTTLFNDTRKLINIIDQLRDYGLAEVISLPRITVLGTQSAGKSSLLENIVGLDFLPRGSGVVTRRPLELRMVHLDPKHKIKSHAIFDVQRKEKYFDFKKVCQKIIELTNKVAGQGKNIVNDPIKLTIYSSDCPDLTLIDLPGITRINIADQTIDIEKVTTEMAKQYCTDERTIILCVIPANQDMSTSDGLKLARQWDPRGQRTIGVITKIDIMDKGVNAQDMLLNKVIPLALGYVGIKNRSQQDINNKVPVQKSLNDEQVFFKTHPAYKDLNQDILGTRALTSKLSNILMKHIAKCIPKIMKQINGMLENCRQQIYDLGDSLPANRNQKNTFLMGLVAKYTENYKSTIRGKFQISQSKQQFEGGAKINQYFRHLYLQYANPQYDCTKEYDDEKIQDAVVLHQGDQISGFPSMDSFKSLIIPQIQKLRNPAYQTIEQIHTQLVMIASKLNKKFFFRFPDLTSQITMITQKILFDVKLNYKLKQKTRQMIDFIIEGQISHIFTNDQEYLATKQTKLSKQYKELQPKQKFITQIRERLIVYFRVVVRSLRDNIPKTIGHFLVKESQDKLHMVIYNQIMNKEKILQSLGEPPQVQKQRIRLNKTLQILKKAVKLIKKDPAYM